MRTFFIFLGTAITLQASPPGIINHQGRIAADGTNINATGHFKFAIVNVRDSETLWTNDDTETGAPGGEPLAAVAIPIVNGHYAAPLGDVTFHREMNNAVPADVFTHNDDRELRIWFSQTGAAKSFELLTPDLRLASVPYALSAASLPNDTVDADHIQDGAVGADALAPNSVGSAEIINNSITAADLAPDSVGFDEIATKSIGSDHIGPNAVNTSEIADNSVTADDLGPNSVGSSEVVNNSLTADDLAAGSVGKSEIATDSIDGSKIIDGSITSSDLADKSVVRGKLGADSVVSATIEDGTLFAVDLAPDSVIRSKIATNAVGSTEIANGSVAREDLADFSVDSDKIANGAVDWLHIDDDAIRSNHILDDAVRSHHIIDAAVGVAHIADGAIRENHIFSGAIEGDHFSGDAIRLESELLELGSASGSDSPVIAFDRISAVIGADGSVIQGNYESLRWNNGETRFEFTDEVRATSFVPTSDRNAKTNFADIDPSSVLEKIAALPITSWTYKSEPAHVRHIGPVAQDFHAAFALGSDDISINTIDADGVALAAIKALKAENDALKAQVQQILRHLGNPDLTATTTAN